MLLALDEALDKLSRRESDKRATGQTAILRRSVPGRSSRAPGHLRAQLPIAIGLTPRAWLLAELAESGQARQSHLRRNSFSTFLTRVRFCARFRIDSIEATMQVPTHGQQSADERTRYLLSRARNWPTQRARSRYLDEACGDDLSCANASRGFFGAHAQAEQLSGSSRARCRRHHRPPAPRTPRHPDRSLQVAGADWRRRHGRRVPWPHNASPSAARWP